ncbi:MAG TPA: hypothetical protein VM529_09680 [Gemmata sp.]|nr:hypothetical protein [Gemmata sp.]
MRVRFKVFRSSFGSWKSLFERAAEFASTLPRDRLISISHSEDRGDGVVTVWYWGDEDETPAEE